MLPRQAGQITLEIIAVLPDFWRQKRANPGEMLLGSAASRKDLQTRVGKLQELMTCLWDAIGLFICVSFISKAVVWPSWVHACACDGGGGRFPFLGSQLDGAYVLRQKCLMDTLEFGFFPHQKGIWVFGFPLQTAATFFACSILDRRHGIKTCVRLQLDDASQN